MSQPPLTRKNSAVTVATLTAASTGGTSSLLNNLSGKGVQVIVNITALAGTSPTLTVTISGIDPASGLPYTLLESTALAADGMTVMTVYPGVTATANLDASAPVPATFQVSWAIGGTSPAVTATIGANIVL